MPSASTAGSSSRGFTWPSSSRSIPAGYLEGSPSTERVLETVERLEEDLTDVATVHRPLAVTIAVRRADRGHGRATGRRRR